MDESLIPKILDGDIALKVAIVDSKGAAVGYLAPITRKSLPDPEMVARLTDWRNRNREYFFTQSMVSCEQTEEWLRSSLLSDNHRLLFVIHADTAPVGTIGFTVLPDGSAEFGNLMRGEPGGGFNLMRLAHRALLAWAFESLHLEIACALVFADNAIAVNHLRSVGFQAKGQSPLCRRDGPNGTSYELNTDGQIVADGARTALKMELARAQWLATRVPETLPPSWYRQPAKPTSPVTQV